MTETELYKELGTLTKNKADIIGIRKDIRKLFLVVGVKDRPLFHH